ncbi:class I SAM-dependent methyltransferase [Roseovarius ramblicola]|uniref:Methyltransferase domain-containing protein n=1 Tax=Roseovarius ramblicola TaxID=2022336 RepID=A0ABV5I0R9_9RHOB
MKIYKPEDIEEFLSKEQLRYQKIDLPFGYSTPGHPRGQIKEILFSESIKGRSVLDVGSFLGQMCVAALQNGAERAVGLELNRDRIRQAGVISEILQLSPQPEYRREDIESTRLEEDFDVVLLLNILHHLRDPIGILRTLTKRVKHRLIIEAASLNRRDAKKLKLGSLSRFLFSRSPAVYVGPCHPKDLSQTYFFSERALTDILSKHLMSYWRIDRYPSEFKGRFILDCKKLSIDRMVLVAGCNSSGKSTFCERVRQNEFSGDLGYDDCSDIPFVNPAKLWGKPLNSVFPAQETSECLMHYDLSLVEKFNLHSFERDPATSVIECSKTIDAVLVAPSIETLKHQIYESEIKNKTGDGSQFHREQSERFGEPGYLLNLYGDWLDYLEGLDSSVTLYVFGETPDGRRLTKCKTIEDARKHIRDTYSVEAPV